MERVVALVEDQVRVEEEPEIIELGEAERVAVEGGGVVYGGVAYGGVAYGGVAYGGVAYGGVAYGGVVYGGVAYGVAYGGVVYGGVGYMTVPDSTRKLSKSPTEPLGPSASITRRSVWEPALSCTFSVVKSRQESAPPLLGIVSVPVMSLPSTSIRKVPPPRADATRDLNR